MPLFDVDVQSMPSRRYGLLLVGPNASGKTTAVERVLAAFSGADVASVFADERDRRMLTGDLTNMGEQLRQGAWDQPSKVLVVVGTNYIAKAAGIMIQGIHGDTIQGGPEKQLATVGSVLNGPADVVIGEGIDRFARAARRTGSERTLDVCVTTQTPEVMKAHLQARCLKKGKRFREDYWVERALIYEGQRRYVNMAKDYFPNATFWPIGLNYEGQDELIAYMTEKVATWLKS
jgi:hypothetical protein